MQTPPRECGGIMLYNTLQHAATHSHTLQLIATLCNTLQHTHTSSMEPDQNADTPEEIALKNELQTPCYLNIAACRSKMGTYSWMYLYTKNRH